MQLIYVEEDQKFLEACGSKQLFWLDDLGAIPYRETNPETKGYLFSSARLIEDYEKLVSPRPGIMDRPATRIILGDIWKTLEVINSAKTTIETPKTWKIGLEESLPEEVSFPLFVRTIERSWKMGGGNSKVENRQQFENEASDLRYAYGWDSEIVAREWLDLAIAGKGMYGSVPQEVRVWCIRGVAEFWSFHFMHEIDDPTGFPISDADKDLLRSQANELAKLFDSRFMVCDFAKLTSGDWAFIEAATASNAGTSHESVFKAAASSLIDQPFDLVEDKFGGRL